MTEKQKDRKKRHKDREAERQKDGKAERPRDRKMEKQRDLATENRNIERQKDSAIENRLSDRETYIQRDQIVNFPKLQFNIRFQLNNTHRIILL